MPVNPRLFNTTPVTFVQKSEATTRFDHRRRTTINVVGKDVPFTMDCQIKWNTSVAEGKPMVTQAGVDEQVLGYVLILTKDLKKINKEIKKDDRITKLENMKVLYYVERLEFGSHYGGEFKLIKVHFTDRRGRDNG